MEMFDFEAHGLDPDRYLTRAGISELAERVFGFRVPVSTQAKLAMRGKGPPTDAMVGNKGLTTTRNAVAFILSRLRKPEAVERRASLPTMGAV
jgi:hypothetical protein